jgi:hypothetical protein
VAAEAVFVLVLETLLVILKTDVLVVSADEPPPMTPMEERRMLEEVGPETSDVMVPEPPLPEDWTHL